MMCKSWCEKNNAVQPVDIRKGTENYASTHANGTGPFMLKSRQPGVRTVLVPNPDWWDKPEDNSPRRSSCRSPTQPLASLRSFPARST